MRWFAALKSILAAFIGIQSQANLQHDFTHGKPSWFIAMGIMGVMLLLLIVYGLVQYIT